MSKNHFIDYILYIEILFKNFNIYVIFIVLHEGFEPPTISFVVMYSNPFELMEHIL